MGVSGKRPFWLHQLAEYVLAAGLLTTGLRADKPLIPAALGIALALNAACVDGPVGAFRTLSRRTHRVIDLVLLAAMIAALFVPGLDSRWVIAGVALVEAFVVMNSNYDKRVKRSAVKASPEGGRSEEAGRLAGRVAGMGVQAYRKRRPSDGA